MRLTSITAALIAGALLAGCGGGGDVPQVRSKADFVAAADKICVDRDTRTKQLVKAADTNVAKLSGQLAAIYADAIVRLEALPLPPGPARAGAKKYVDSVVALRRPVAHMKASADVLAAADSDADVKRASATLERDVNSVQAISDLSDLTARSYGFKDCGQQQALNPVS